MIPTRLARPDLLHRAVASARAQAGVDVDVMVVVNNAVPGAPRPALPDDVAVIEAAVPGVGAARNAGAAAAATGWVAFLDDDDAWAPDKLACQLAVAARHGPDTIVATRYRFLVDGRVIAIRPAHTPRPGQDLSEWLLCARWPLSTGAHAGASSLVAHRALLARCGFGDMPIFEDHDWILRAGRRHSARFVQMPAPLTDYHHVTGQPHAAGRGSWHDIERWVDANPDLLTPRSAAAALLLTGVRLHDARREYRHLVAAAFARGRPHPLDVLASLAVAQPATRQWRRTIGDRMARLRHGPAASTGSVTTHSDAAAVRSDAPGGGRS